MTKPKNAVPKPLRIPLERQVYAISKLLTIWPQAKGKTVERYVRDTLGVSLTGTCLQEAREALGLAEAQHTEKTLEKKALAETVVYNLVEHHGVLGISNKELASRVQTALRRQFQEGTSSRLVSNWVEDTLQRLRPYSNNPGRLIKMIQSCKKELDQMGLLDPESKQLHLL